VELRHLRYFVSVAEQRSFTQAAAQLRVAQPALSRQLRQLEEEVGVLLFHRSPKGVKLTGAGEAFLAEARQLLQRAADAVQAAKNQGAAERGQLRVGYVWGLFHTQAPALISRFRKAHPEVAVHLLDLTSTQQAAQLADGKLDLGFIGFAQESDQAGLEKRKIGSCSLVAALPSGHPTARRRSVPLRALAEDFFLMLSEQTYPGVVQCVLDGCTAAGFKPRVLQVADRGYTLLGLIASGCGVTLLPESVRELPHPGVVFRPLQEEITADLCLAWRGPAQNPWIQQFLDLLS
jgi:DNA-binding transcriptional LysR family regulator